MQIYLKIDIFQSEKQYKHVKSVETKWRFHSTFQINVN